MPPWGWMERSGVLLGTISETGFARAKRLQPNVGRSLKRKRTASDAVLCFCFGFAVSSAQIGTGVSQPGAIGRSQRPAAVGQAGRSSHSARHGRASFHYGKNDTELELKRQGLKRGPSLCHCQAASGSGSKAAECERFIHTWPAADEAGSSALAARASTLPGAKTESRCLYQGTRWAAALRLRATLFGEPPWHAPGRATRPPQRAATHRTNINTDTDG